MCLTTRWKFPRITTKEKVVYKIVYKNPIDEEVCYAGVTKFRYRYNILHKEPIFKHLWSDNIFDTFSEFKDGWVHSFNSLESAIESMECYSCYQLGTRRMPENIIIVKCIIPRFTLYYKGMDGDICSKKIIIKEEVK